MKREGERKVLGGKEDKIQKSMTRERHRRRK
jgi:hypothetical protein